MDLRLRCQCVGASARVNTVEYAQGETRWIHYKQVIRVVSREEIVPFALGGSYLVQEARVQGV